MTHLDLDELADVLCGEAGAEATEHAATCPACSAALTDLEAAQVPLLARLATLPDPEPPAGLDERLLAAVARERRTQTSAGAANVLPLPAGRRPPAWLTGAAAAAALIGVVGGGIALLPHGAPRTQSSSATASTAGTAGLVVRRLASGTGYRKVGPSFASALPLLLGAASPGAVAGPQLKTDERKAGAVDPLGRLRDEGALAGCLASLTTPEDPGVPLAVDYATYEGAPAIIVVLPSPKPATVDVYVVGPACTPADADLRYFVRLPRP